MKAVRFDPILTLLSVAQILAAPVLLFKKWRRFRARGDAYEWDMARWRAPKSVKNDGFHLVLVAMGFAETRLAARLTDLIQAQRPEWRISWAIRNAEAARAGHAIPAGQNVVPLPFDFAWPVRNWIEATRPDAVVFIERFAFPQFARGLSNRGVRVGAVAARTRNGKKAGWFERWLWGAFDVMGLRSEAERKNFGAFALDNSAFRVTGSLKFWPEVPTLPPEREKALHLWLQGERPLLAAGSTQPGDESWILEAFAPLKNQYSARLLLAPRHVERADEIEKLARERGFSVARRSQSAGDASADVLLLDTLGELASAYGACRAAFIGGTLAGTGHNVLEPIAHGIAAFYGPKRGTFSAEQERCEAAGVGFRVENPQELTRGWEKALTDENWRVAIANQARDLNARGALAWEATVAAILELGGSE